MKEVHFVLQGKGGVGKSFTACLLAQYLRDRADAAVYCFDTDPNNHTLANYAALLPQIIELLDETTQTIDTSHFDGLMDSLIDTDGYGVVDNGTATFGPLMAYIAENDVADILADEGVRLVLHIPLNGGQAKDECLKGMVQILQAVNADAVIWLNEHKGKIHENGKPFDQFKVYEKYKKRIAGIIRIPALNADTYGKNIADMTERNLTFDEIDAAEFGRWARNRLLKLRDTIWTQLDDVSFLATQNKQSAAEAESRS